jgi:dTDP-glucose pyrophosphorylase/CBS domain-containing protein
MTRIPVERLFVSPQASLRECMHIMDLGAEGIALVVDEGRRLLGTVTDGDVRRAILDGVDLGAPMGAFVSRGRVQRRSPMVALVGATDSELLRMMNESTLRHVPLVDLQGRVKGIALLRELAREYELPLLAVVMAGGLGTRLRPLTEGMPKPMLPVGGRPLLELMIEQLRRAGVRKVKIATHYKAEVIRSHFGDGRAFGVDLQYLEEDEPLGTAGALSLMEESDDVPILVLNGDVVTRVDFRAMLDFHREQGADITVAIHREEFALPFGVVECDGIAVTGLSEKPTIGHLVNAGIYMIDPRVVSLIHKGQPTDMPSLISLLLQADGRVVGFLVHEYWRDIGQPEDYSRAVAEARGAFDE